MTLLECSDLVAPHFPAGMRKDLKTAVRILAQALGHPDPQSCPLESCQESRASLLRLVENLLVAQGKGAHTIRNTKNLLSRLFRLAEAQGIFSLVPSPPKRQFVTHKITYAKRNHHAMLAHDGSYLRRRDWPPALEAEFARFERWATDPVVEDRDARWQKRWTTLKSYESLLEAYFGYLTRIRHLGEPSFDQLFDFNLIQGFIHWHINVKQRRPTIFAQRFLQMMLAITRQYRGDHDLLVALKALKKRTPRPIPTYQKSEAWLPLREMERIGLAMWPAKLPHQLARGRPTPGTRTAAQAGISLMFRLWVHIPYRSRNIRTMCVGEHLYRTPEGQWRIRFAGEELKVAMKRGQRNVFDLPFPPALVPTLEAYLQTWRPILSRLQQRRELFLSTNGNAYTVKTLYHVTRRHVFAFTGRPWHPHLIRTVWATEWIQSGGDFMTAAIMLNDRLETVIATYAHLLDENVAEKAFAWVQGRVNGH